MRAASGAALASARHPLLGVLCLRRRICRLLLLPDRFARLNVIRCATDIRFMLLPVGRPELENLIQNERQHCFHDERIPSNAMALNIKG
jgi:hypothetical protein